MDASWHWIDDEHSLLRQEAPPTGAVRFLAPVALAQRCWPGRTPRPADLEHAIDLVEEAIEASGLRHAARDTLRLDAHLHAALAGLLNGLSAAGLAREQVEQAFATLVAQVQAGRPVVAGGGAIAALLMLRELVHHLGFVRVVVEAA